VDALAQDEKPQIMNSPSRRELDAMWARHHAEWREPAQIASQWRDARDTDPKLLQSRTRGAWWEAIETSRITLLVTREYEHLVMALTVTEGKPKISYFPLPHPSGLVVDRRHRVVHIASTRNPNQMVEFKPVTGLVPRSDVELETLSESPLVPVRSRFYPGSFYLHDLALINGRLHANAVGQNAVVSLGVDGGARRVWWPRCIETRKGPVFEQNHIQLNSIAASTDLSRSFFSASADRMSRRRPGHRNFPTDGRGVIFDGATREPLVRGLTRPHSARLHRKRLWVANSGYGEVGFVRNGNFESVTRLPGWTRGLCFRDRIAYVGTSRVIPRFRRYAPGLDIDASLCGLHAVDISTGIILGSLIWPYGNQIFGVDWAPRGMTTGLPFATGKRSPSERTKKLFYAFSTTTRK
jgi:uncharacterized protein (TIGR03032 family)